MSTSTNTFRAYATQGAGQPLQPFEFDAGPLGDEEVEISVDTCGICHSDLSMKNNEWGMTTYPFVPGHEATGRISALGSRVQDLQIGQKIGIGWYSRSCMRCPQCLAGDHNLCIRGQATIIGRHGGFADRLRCHWSWAIPLPDSLDAKKAGPLFCGGITVFNPILQNDILPTQRVGVIGIGGLGHLALQFLNKWGCEVWAFTSTDSKADEARRMGAHHVVNSRDVDQMKKIAGKLHFVLSTVNVTLDWAAVLDVLGSKGRLHVVGAALEPIPVPAFALISGQKSVSGSPLGSPATVATMLDFCARHDIAPITEHFPMSKVNDAFEHLHAGKARYRLVLENDFAV